MRVLLLIGITLAASLSSAQVRDWSAWREMLSGYSRQTPERRAQIQRELPEFARRFAELVMETPEYKNDLAIGKAIGADIDRVVDLMANGSLQANEAKSELDRVQKKYEHVKASLPQKIAEDTARMYVQVIRQGLEDREPSVQRAAQATLQSLTVAHYSPRLSVSFYLICDTISHLGRFKRQIDFSISNLVREQAKKRPLLFIDSIRARSEGYESMLLAMAEAKSPLVRKTILDLVRSRRDEDVDLGLHCLINWPIPEALPSLINQIQTSEKNIACLETALVCYGEAGLRAMLRAWPTLTEGARYIAFRAAYHLPSQAALNLVLQGVRDRRSEVRVEAVEALGSLQSIEWYETYAGRDPRNLDRRRVSQLLKELARDPDEAVRDAARRALEQG